MAPADLPGPEEPLLDGGFLDSLAMIDFVSFLEQEFGVTLSDDDVMLENFESIDAVADLIRSKTAGEAWRDRTRRNASWLLQIGLET